MLTKLLAALLAVLLSIASAHAQVLTDRVPANTLVYVGWQGADKLQPAYQKSNLKGVLDASSLSAFFDKQLPDLLAKAARPDNAAALNQALAAAKAMWQYPTAVCVLPFDLTNPEQPKPRLAILCQAGPDKARALLENLTALIANAREPDTPLAVRQAGDTVLFTVGHLNEPTLDMLRGNAPVVNNVVVLAQSPAFKATLPHIDKDAALTCYIDATALRQNLLDALAKSSEPQARELGPKIISAAGLDALTTIAYTGTFADQRWSEKTFIGTTGPRTGLLALFDAKPVDPAALKLIPKDVPACAVGRLDAAKVWADLRAGIGQVDPQALKDFDAAIAKANKFLDADIAKEILAPLGDQWVSYRTLRPNDRMMPLGFLLAIQLRDAKTMAATLLKLEDALADLPPAFRTGKTKVGDAEATTLRMPGITFGWLIHGNYLVIGLADDLPAAVEQITRQETSILDNPDFAALYQAFGDKATRAVTLDFGSPKAIYPAWAMTLRQMLNVAAMTGTTLPADLIPDAEKSAPFMTPGASIGYADAAGFHVVGTSAFPGAGVLTSQQSTLAPAAAVGTAVLVPALSRARETARRTAEAANLHGIGTAAAMHIVEWNRRPEHLAQLVANGYLTPKVLTSPRGSTKPATFTAAELAEARKDWHKIQKAIDEHCDFIYVGKDLPTSIEPAQTHILAYPDPARTRATNGLNILFADGHIEFLKPADLTATFKRANEARAKLKLAPLTIPALGVQPATTPAK